MNNNIIEKMVEETLFDVLNDQDKVQKVLDRYQDTFYLYATQYLLLSIVSNDLVKIIFKLSDIDELKEFNEEELTENLQEFKEIENFKQYLLHNAMLDYEKSPEDFLGFDTSKGEHNEENLLNKNPISIEYSDELTSVLSNLAMKSLKKEQAESSSETIDLKNLLGAMLKEVANSEREAAELNEDYKEDTFFEEVIEDEDARIIKDEEYDITKFVVIEEEGIKIDTDEDADEDADEDWETDNLDEELPEGENEFELEEMTTEWSEELPEDDEQVILDDATEFEDDMPEVESDYEDELGFTEDDEQEFEDDMPEVESDNEDDMPEVTDEENTEAIVAEMSDGEYGGFADEYVENVKAAKDNEDVSDDNYDSEKYYKIKDDEELQTILKIRRTKNIILFFLLFACIGLAVLFVVLK